MEGRPQRFRATADLDAAPEPDAPALLTDDLESLADPDARLEVELLPDGRMRAPSQVTRDILRDRMRFAEVLPTGPGWAVIRSRSHSDADATAVLRREVVAAGTLGDKGISIIDFIGFLASGYQTGVLSVAHDDVERSIYFHNGDVVWAASTAPEDRLGELLVERGKITKDQLELAISGGSAMRIGRECVERGFVSAHQLWLMVQAQLREIFDRLLATEQGTWAFARVDASVLAESQIHLSTQGLLVDALRRLDELQVYRQRIRSLDVRVQRVQHPSLSGTGDLIERLDDSVRDDAMSAMGTLAGPATLRDLVRALGKSEFEITRVVYHLLRGNLVEVVNPNETGPIPRRHDISKTAAHDVIEVYSMAIREMVDDLGRVGRSKAFRTAAQDFLRDETGTGAYADLLRQVVLGPDGSIQETQVIAGAAEHGISLQELSDALSELLFFLLFQATELLGRRRGDDLARRVKMIHAMLSQRSEELAP